MPWLSPCSILNPVEDKSTMFTGMLSTGPFAPLCIQTPGKLTAMRKLLRRSKMDVQVHPQVHFDRTLVRAQPSLYRETSTVFVLSQRGHTNVAVFASLM